MCSSNRIDFRRVCQHLTGSPASAFRGLCVPAVAAFSHRQSDAWKHSIDTVVIKHLLTPNWKLSTHATKTPGAVHA